MKCQTVNQMNRVAMYGMQKMGGYTFTLAGWGDGSVYEITTPDATVYSVDPELGWCSCPFHMANRHLAPHTTCKHALYVESELAREEAMQDYLDDCAYREAEAAQ